jgi:hypothetical protein
MHLISSGIVILSIARNLSPTLRFVLNFLSVFCIFGTLPFLISLALPDWSYNPFVKLLDLFFQTGMTIFYLGVVYKHSFFLFLGIFSATLALLVSMKAKACQTALNVEARKSVQRISAVIGMLYVPFAVFAGYFLENWNQLEFLGFNDFWWPIITRDNSIVHFTEIFGLFSVSFLAVHGLVYGYCAGLIMCRFAGTTTMRHKN